MHSIVNMLCSSELEALRQAEFKAKTNTVHLLINID